MLPTGIRRLFRLFRGHGDVEDDLDAEIAFHLDTKVEALVAAGMSPGAARREALRQFGDMRAARAALAAIDHRDTGRRLRTEWLEAAWSDLRFAARGLRRSPGFTATVVVTLALGLGATAAMFGVLDRLLLRPPIGVRNPERVVQLLVRRHVSVRGSLFRRYFPYSELDDFSGPDALSAAAFGTLRPLPVPLDDDAGSTDARADLVSGSYFSLLGVNVVLGRPLQPADDSAASPAVAVISYGLWKSRYGGAPSVVGKTIRVSGLPCSVVGVAPPGFSGLSPGDVDVWLPAATTGNAVFGTPSKWFDWHTNVSTFEAIARLTRGQPRARAEGELTLAYQRHRALLPPSWFEPMDPAATVVLGSIIPGRAQVETGDLGESLSLSLLVAAVALIVCLIAVANVANLLLLRSFGRRRETGIRLALGVGRWRLVRATLAESLLLAALAAVAAALVASVGGEVLRRLLVETPWPVPLLGLRVFAFVGVTAFAVGSVTGLVPAFFGGRTDVVASLKAGMRHSAWRRSRMRAALVVGQVAMTLLLLAGFGLFARSLGQAERVDIGVDVHHLAIVDPMRTRTPALPGSPGLSTASLNALLQRVRSLGGVRAAALAATAIPMYSFTVKYLRAEGVDSVANSSAGGGPFFSEIGPGYLDAVGLRLLRGRAFEPSEYASPATVSLVSEEMARRLWPGQNAIGKCLYVKLDMASKEAPPCSAIVGIVGNVRQQVTEPPLMQYYLPLPSDVAASHAEIVVRAAGDASSLVAPLRTLTKAVQPDLASLGVMPLSTILGRQLSSWALGSKLLAMFAGLALLVAIVGIYAVVAFDAAQRRGELGIRVALGARGRDLAGLMLGKGLRYGVIGAVLGLLLVAVAGRLVASQLFHTSPRDPLALGAAALLLLAAMLAACALPARAAARADPRIALQAD
jgi:putative ABC transport system permease protein